MVVSSAIGALLLEAALFTALPAVAQTTTGSAIRVQPALFEQVVNPGDRFSSSVTVTNPDPTTKTFTVGVQDIKDINGSGEPVFSTTTVPEYGVSSWVSIGVPTVTIAGYGSKQIPFTITVPKDATPGGHYGAIFVTYGATRPAITGSGVGYQVGSLIDLRIAGEANEQAEIREFSTDKGLYQGPNVAFTASVADLGNVLLRPRGPIDIVNMFGQKVATVVMNDGNEAIFPGSSRSFNVVWQGSGFMAGRFDAVMSLTYGNETQKTVSASTSFWIIPFTPILAVLGSVIFFVLIFVWSLRAYVRRKVQGMTGGRGGKASLSEEERFLYENRMPFSRLAFIVIATAVFAVVFLIILFFLFG